MKTQGKTGLKPENQMKTKWIYNNSLKELNRETNDYPNIINDFCRQFNISRIIAALLVTRGINSIEQADQFLNPALSSLKDPFSLKDMKKAVKRLWQAIINKEKILIFGDFDADGVTATSLLVDFFTYIETDVTWYIPHRTKEGYGIQKNHINMFAEQDIDLIITVDCGSGSYEAVKIAAMEDIDIIITDHHEIASPPPSCAAIINPKQKECLSDLEHLAGVGVAFYLLMALRKYLRIKNFWVDIEEPNLLNYCDLVALGTIGDMVPLKDENRILSIHGIKVIKKGRRIGIKTLIQVSRIRIENLDSDDIGFRLIPRINAAGRLSHARICVGHLTSNDRISSIKTSALLNELNLKRQKIEHEIVNDIVARIEKNKQILNKKILILWDQKWNASVLGIAASHLVRKYSRPVILISTLSDPFTGSCRSINSINIHDALSVHSNLLERFGGHSMAAGITICKENIEKFANAMETYIDMNFDETCFLKSVNIELAIALDKVTFELAEQINRLRPFGVGNPEPLFSCKKVRVVSSAIIGLNHRKMVLKDINGVREIEAFQFNIKNNNDLPMFFKEIAFKIKINRFKPSSPQIIIEYP